ncbi:MAG: DUF2079 domain-containing protein, partial [Candidatus Omnitrophota bacterium]
MKFRQKAGLAARGRVEKDDFLTFWSDAGAWLMIGAYVLVFTIVSLIKYDAFMYNDFDLAVHAQTLYNIVHGSIESSILGVPFLGNHLNFILFLIAPLYAIWKSPVVLLVLQALALGISAYPVYLIAKEHLPRAFSLLILCAYLLYPALGYLNLYEFHPTVFATLFLAAAMYCILREKFMYYLIFLLFAFLCQENIPLVVFFLGVYLLVIKKTPRWWVTTIIVSAACFWLGAYQLIPHFGKGMIKFIGIYGYLGSSLSEVAKNIMLHPIQVSGILLKKGNIIYVTQIFGPLAFLPLLSPVSLLACVPTLLQHMLSLRMTEQTIYYHYTAELIPFIFCAAIMGMKRALRFPSLAGKERSVLGALFAVIVVSNLILGPAKNVGDILTRPKNELHFAKEAFLAKIPRDAEVAATFAFLPKLSGRQKLYSLHHAIMGKYTLSDVPYELPATTHYALADFDDDLTFKSTFYTSQGGANLRRLFADGRFGLVAMVESIALFKRGAGDAEGLYRILPREPAPQRRCNATVNAEIELIGCDIDRARIPKGVLELRFFWKCLKKTEKTYGAFIELSDRRSGTLMKRAPRFIWAARICAGFLPTEGSGLSR